MISELELKTLMQYAPEPGSRALSVYLSVDQGYAPNLNRGFEVTLKNLLREVEDSLENAEQKSAFTADAQKAWAFIKNYSPATKTLVYVCNSRDGFEWHGGIRLALASQAHWTGRPFVRPLMAAWYEHERYGIVLTDRAQARLFTVVQNEIEEHREAFAEAEVKRFDTTAKDKMWSQMQFQHKADEHARWHLKHVAGLLSSLAQQHRFGRLVVAGLPDATAELSRLLPEYMTGRVIGTVALPLDAAEKDILAATERCFRDYERVAEQQVLDRLLTSARKNSQAVIGLPDTLKAAGERRVLELVFAEGYEAQGAECGSCGSLTGDRTEACPQCGGGMRDVDDILERLVEGVVREGGMIEQVSDAAAESLKRHADGIGALLRF